MASFSEYSPGMDRPSRMGPRIPMTQNMTEVKGTRHGGDVLSPALCLWALHEALFQRESAYVEGDRASESCCRCRRRRDTVVHMAKPDVWLWVCKSLVFVQILWCPVPASRDIEAQRNVHFALALEAATLSWEREGSSAHMSAASRLRLLLSSLLVPQRTGRDHRSFLVRSMTAQVRRRPRNSEKKSPGSPRALRRKQDALTDQPEIPPPRKASKHGMLRHDQ